MYLLYYSLQEGLWFTELGTWQCFATTTTRQRDNVLELRCLNGVATTNKDIIQWLPIFWPQNTVTWSRQCCRVPSSGDWDTRYGRVRTIFKNPDPSVGIFPNLREKGLVTQRDQRDQEKQREGWSTQGLPRLPKVPKKTFMKKLNWIWSCEVKT